MPVKGGGGIGGPKKAKSKSVGAAVSHAGKPLKRKPPRQAVGAAVARTGSPLKPKPASLKRAPKGVGGSVKAGTVKRDALEPRSGRKKVKKVVPRVAPAIESGTTIPQVRAVKVAPTPQGKRQVVRAVKREVQRQETKKLQRAVIEGAPVSDRPLFHRQSTLDRLLKGPDMKLTTDSKGRVVERPQSPDKAEAAALKVLNETMRTSRAVSGGVQAIVEGAKKGEPTSTTVKHVGQAWKKGLVDNEGPGFQKLLRDQGVPKGIAAPVGFAADVFTDPATYVTAGTGSAAARAGEKAGASAAKRAAKAGMSKAGQETVARAAAKRAAGRAGEGRAVWVKFAGREVPAVRASTAKAGKATTKLKPAGKGRARSLTREVRPQVAPAGASREAQDIVRAGTGSARAAQNVGMAEGERQAKLLARLSAEEQRRVIDAVERGRIAKLPEHLREVAVDLRSANRYATRMAAREGVSQRQVRRGNVKQVVEAGSQAAARARRLKKVTPDAGAARKAVQQERRRLARIERELASARENRAIAQGRAEVLSRNVGGREAEKAAQRAFRDPQAGRRAKTSKDRWDLLRYIDEAPTRAHYAGGRLGLTDAERAVQTAERRLAGSRKRLARRESESAATSRVAAEQNALRRQLGIGEGEVISPAVARTLAERQARRQSGYARDYVRHVDAAGVSPSGIKPRGARKGTVKQGTQRERNDPRPISVQNREGANLSTDLGVLQADLHRSQGRAVANARLAQAFLRAGKDVSRGHQGMRATGAGVDKAPRHVPLKDTEVALHIHGSKINVIDPEHVGGELVAKVGERPGRYVVLNKELVNDALSTLARHGSDSEILGAIKSGTGKFKRVVAFNPAFQFRNAIGDLLSHYSEVSPRETGRVLKKSGQSVARLSKGDRSRQLRPTQGKGTITVGGERMTIDAFAAELRDLGIARSGFVGREVEDLTHSGRRSTRAEGSRVASGRPDGKKVLRPVKAAGRGWRRGWDAADRWLQNREDLLRVATYKALRDRGMSRADARNMVMNVHVDYGEVSKFEADYARVVMPYYTWTARQLPEQTKRLVTRPGKAANFEKARQNTAEYFGTQGSPISEFDRRMVPFVVKVGKDTKTIAISPPYTLFNELPTGFRANDVTAWADEFAKFLGSSLNPIMRAPLTVGVFKTDPFFRAPIEPATGPLKPAPQSMGWVLDRLSAATGTDWRELTGYRENYRDKQSGKTVPGWRGNADYLMRELTPGVLAVLRKIDTPGQDKGRQTTAEEVVNALAGINVRSSNPTQVQMSDRFSELDGVLKELGTLRQLSRTTAEDRRYAALSDRKTALEREIAGLSKRLGYRDPYFKNRLRRKRQHSNPLGSGLGGIATTSLSGL